MSHPTCKICTSWKPPDEAAMKYAHGYGECKSPAVQSGLLNGFQDVECHGGILTGPDFYCPHHSDLRAGDKAIMLSELEPSDRDWYGNKET